MATLIESTVDPGATGDYLNLFAAEADNFAATGVDFVSNDEYAECSCVCTNGAADTTTVTVQGQTTDSTRNITCLVPAAYQWVAGFPASGNIYRLVVSGNGILNYTEDFVLSGFAVKLTTTGNNQVAIYSVHSLTVSDTIAVLANPSVGHTGPLGFCVLDGAVGNHNFKARNCIAIDFRNSTTSGKGFFGSYGPASTSNKNYWHNCLAANCQTGFQEYYGSTIAKNCAAVDCTVDYDNPAGFTVAGTSCIGPTAGASLAWGATRTTGTTTGAAASKLIDTGKNFTTLGVRAGSHIKNTTDSTYAYVTAVDSPTQLSISADIMASGENYTIYYNLVGVPDFVDAANDNFHLAADADNLAYRTGADLDGDANLPVTTDIDGETRHASTPCIGPDEVFLAPTVTSVTPDTGSESGGTEVTIAGTGFLTGATVLFDTEAATSVVVSSEVELTCTTPAHAAGAVTVRVTNPTTQYGELESAFTYEADEPDPGLPGGAVDPSRREGASDEWSWDALRAPFLYRQNDIPLPIPSPGPDIPPRTTEESHYGNIS